MKKIKINSKPKKGHIVLGSITLVCALVVYVICFSELTGVRYTKADNVAVSVGNVVERVLAPTFNAKEYDRKMELLANYASTTATSTVRTWPAKAVYPNVGAILPDKRIIAYYGNFYSKKMGVLGEYPPEVMKKMLLAEVAAWDAIDPTTKAIPAINYIASTAQLSPGKEGLYTLRMPDTEIDKAVQLAKEVNGIVILDVQVGLSTLQKELPYLDAYLQMPEVHLALDPEFSMKGGDKPGTVIGTFDATDINYAAQYLANIVREHNLPPKVLIVHRFTHNMLTRTSLIEPLPEVQIVIDMDGWGDPAKKLNTYKKVVVSEPVQFTGFKIFYKNDLKPPSTRLLTPRDLLNLTPRPSFIQYQ